jgi:uncharacterized RDD family membrane protein YckC
MRGTPYAPPSVGDPAEVQAKTVSLAGFGRRFLAFCIDALPITLGVFGVFCLFLGFEQAIQRRLSNPTDIAARID